MSGLFKLCIICLIPSHNSCSFVHDYKRSLQTCTITVWRRANGEIKELNLRHKAKWGLQSSSMFFLLLLLSSHSEPMTWASMSLAYKQGYCLLWCLGKWLSVSPGIKTTRVYNDAEETTDGSWQEEVFCSSLQKLQPHLVRDLLSASGSLQPNVVDLDGDANITSIIQSEVH